MNNFKLKYLIIGGIGLSVLMIAVALVISSWNKIFPAKNSQTTTIQQTQQEVPVKPLADPKREKGGSGVGYSPEDE